MVQGYSSQDCSGTRSRCSGRFARKCSVYSSSTYLPMFGGHSYFGGYPYEQWHSYSATKLKLRWSQTPGREVGGFMLNITGLNRFYYLCGFHDMRCKHERVLSIIHQQLNSEPKEGDVFIVMSKNHRLIRLFSFDKRSCSLYEKRFAPGYKFMNIEFENDFPVHTINWEDVLLLLESLLIKTLNIK